MEMKQHSDKFATSTAELANLDTQLAFELAAQSKDEVAANEMIKALSEVRAPIGRSILCTGLMVHCACAGPRACAEPVQRVAAQHRSGLQPPHGRAADHR